MGTILNAKLEEDGSVTHNISLGKEESLALKGFMENIHIFAEGACLNESRISMRGKNDSTIYFLIPKKFREKGVNSKSDVRCQRIESKHKDIYVFVVDKIKL
ncbi:MAG: hypothetical protein V1859_01755 [archaeon]